MFWDRVAFCYQTQISDARWIAYDIPGNLGWIAYFPGPVYSRWM